MQEFLANKFGFVDTPPLTKQLHQLLHKKSLNMFKKVVKLFFY